MPTYTIDVVLQSDTNATGDTDFRNGNWELTGAMTTLTINDEDGNGLGDNDPSTETGSAATIQAVGGDTTHPLVGTDIFGKYIRSDSDFGGADNTPDVLFLGTGSGFNNFAATTFPGAGWSMQTGDTFTANSTTTTDPTGGSWSREAQLDTAPCFTPGAWIDTKTGPMPIEDLRPGDLVQTRDNGLQPVNWLFRRDMSANWLDAHRHHAPICIRAGSLGPGIPSRHIHVSPMHLMLMTHGSDEHLVYARDLLPNNGVFRTLPHATAYLHLLMDQHEVVRVNGVWSESFQTSAPAMARIGADTRAELMRLFPNLDPHMPSVRPRIASG
ncbi:MAG: Hint domain-containing protein, partial [Pseudomonadota bacterium]